MVLRGEWRASASGLIAGRLVELDGELVLCVEVSGTYGVNVWGAERAG